MALTDNLVAYYKLDGNSNDSVGSNNGTDTSISYVAGKINQGSNFNGTSSYISLGSSTALSCTTSGFTISMWLNTSNNSKAQFAYCKFEYPSENFAITYGDTGANILTVRFNDSTSSYIYTNYTVNLSNNVWYYVSATYDGSSLILYLNGNEVSRMSTSAVPLALNGTGYIGIRYPSFVPWVGLIDEVGIWSRALTSTEVTTLYNSGAGNQYPFVGIPLITTTSVSHITNRNAQLNLELTSDGGATTTIGTCHSTAPNPVSTDNPYTKIAGVGTYQLDIPNLLANTKYYVRSFATNSAGTSYGAELDFTTNSEAKILLQENGRALLSNSKTIKI